MLLSVPFLKSPLVTVWAAWDLPVPLRMQKCGMVMGDGNNQISWATHLYDIFAGLEGKLDLVDHLFVFTCQWLWIVDLGVRGLAAWNICSNYFLHVWHCGRKWKVELQMLKFNTFGGQLLVCQVLLIYMSSRMDQDGPPWRFTVGCHVLGALWYKNLSDVLLKFNWDLLILLVAAFICWIGKGFQWADFSCPKLYRVPIKNFYGAIVWITWTSKSAITLRCIPCYSYPLILSKTASSIQHTFFSRSSMWLREFIDQCTETGVLHAKNKIFNEWLFNLILLVITMAYAITGAAYAVKATCWR